MEKKSVIFALVVVLLSAIAIAEQVEYSGYIVQFRDTSVGEKYLALSKDNQRLINQEQRMFPLNPARLYYNLFLIKDESRISSEVRTYSSSLDQTTQSYVDEIVKEFKLSNDDIGPAFNKGIAGITLYISDEQAARLMEKPYVRSVSRNTIHRLMMDESVSILEADQAWQQSDASGLPLDGTGVRIAVLDSGFDLSHPAFSGLDVVTQQCYCIEQDGSGCCPNGDSEMSGQGSLLDTNGHGTHVLGTMGSQDQVFRGIAPGAEYILIKGMDTGGFASSDIIKAMELAMDPNKDGSFTDHADIMSMSLGMEPEHIYQHGSVMLSDGTVVSVHDVYQNHCEYFKQDYCSEEEIHQQAVMEFMGIPHPNCPDMDVCGPQVYLFNYKPELDAIKTATDLGVTFVVAAGNRGADGREGDRGYLSLYGMIEEPIVVGALAKDDQIAPYSSRGTAFNGIAGPDVVATGGCLFSCMDMEVLYSDITDSQKIDYIRQYSEGGIASALSSAPDCVTGALGSLGCLDQYVTFDGQSGRYIAFEGTSMATPHVSGLLALVKQKNPDWTPAQLQAALKDTAEELGFQPYEQGAGKIDIMRLLSYDLSCPGANILEDEQNCGACGNVCSGTCTEGVCFYCGDTRCSSEETACGCPEDCLETGSICCGGIEYAGECCSSGDCPDGLACSDNQCIEAPSEICDDHIDNDGDNLFDCLDPDCSAVCSSYCPGCPSDSTCDVCTVEGNPYCVADDDCSSCVADGTCVDGCSPADPDCGSVCNDGVVGPGETCDRNCPTTCDDCDPCTVDAMVSDGPCQVSCVHDYQSSLPGCGCGLEDECRISDDCDPGEFCEDCSCIPFSVCRLDDGIGDDAEACDLNNPTCPAGNRCDVQSCQCVGCPSEICDNGQDDDCDADIDCDDSNCADESHCQPVCDTTEADVYDWCCEGLGYTWTGSPGILACCGDDYREDSPYLPGGAGVRECPDAAHLSLDDDNDNDCDNSIDEGCPCLEGETKLCLEQRGVCSGGMQECIPSSGGYIWSECNLVPQLEVCDGLDNNCDGIVDEGCPACVPTTEVCDGVDNDCDGEVDEGCPACEPSAEVCDGVDNDCDGEVDEGCPPICDPGEEECDGIDNNDDCEHVVDEGCPCEPIGEGRDCGTDVGACVIGTQYCLDDGDGDEVGEWGYACDGAIEPADEICCNMIDDDCDGETDEECFQCPPEQCPLDQADVTQECCESLGFEWTGYEGMFSCCGDDYAEDDPYLDGGEGVRECPGPNNLILQDAQDNDCDSAIDEGCPCEPGEVKPCLEQRGICKGSMQTCEPDPQGGYAWSECGQRPELEICDRLDNNCNGIVDEGCPCDPSEEVCDGLDNDCNGQIDEQFDSDECEPKCLLDAAWNGGNNGVLSCCGDDFDSSSENPLDREDSPYMIFTPSEEPHCDGNNNDCDLVTDEGCPCGPIGSTRSCGTDEGECVAGVQYCVEDPDSTVFEVLARLFSSLIGDEAPGVWSNVCEGSLGPVDELCENGLDDDCDGLADENCQDVCVPSPEICDGIDNDCDGSVDEGFEGDDCEGACEGTWLNGNHGILNCCGDDFAEDNPFMDYTNSEAPNCDDNNNDCDLVIDEGCPCTPIGDTKPCGYGEGECVMGLQTCVEDGDNDESGIWSNTCEDAVGPVDEICGDGLDNDCDGETDENCLVDECGDGEVDAGEDCRNCPDDAGCGYGLLCQLAGSCGTDYPGVCDNDTFCDADEACDCPDCLGEQDGCMEGDVCTDAFCGCDPSSDGYCSPDPFCGNTDPDCSGCPIDTSLCQDGTCSHDCEITDTGFQGCILQDGVCDDGEGCACPDCEDMQDSCSDGLVCNYITQLCGPSFIEECPAGTRLCGSGHCCADCSDASCGGEVDCKDPEICEAGDSCACAECDLEQDSCQDGAFCSIDTMLCVGQCPAGTTLCEDFTCSPDCSTTDGGAADCIVEDGICSFGEGCACSDCEGDQDSCGWGAYCMYDADAPQDSLCAGQCQIGTALCADNTCQADCSENGGLMGCDGAADGVCESGEGCGCSDCEDRQDSCVRGAVCSDGLCSRVQCPEGTALCNDGSCSADCIATDNGYAGCLNSNTVCDFGEGCGCYFCDSYQDSCEAGLTCDYVHRTCEETLIPSDDDDDDDDDDGPVGDGRKGSSTYSLDWPDECDQDNDGYGSPDCDGDDCNDRYSDVNPGEDEICNKIDDDCDGIVDNGCDDDKDGYCDSKMRVASMGAYCKPGDCDDTDPSRHPGKQEICNSIDDDCDGRIDDDCGADDSVTTGDPSMDLSITPSKANPRVLSTLKIDVEIENMDKSLLENLKIDLKVPDGWKVASSKNIRSLSPGSREKVTFDVMVLDYTKEKAQLTAVATVGSRSSQKAFDMAVEIPDFLVAPEPTFTDYSDKLRGNSYQIPVYYVLKGPTGKNLDIELDINDPLALLSRTVIIDFLSVKPTSGSVVRQLGSYTLPKGKRFIVDGYLYEAGSGLNRIRVKDQSRTEIVLN